MDKGLLAGVWQKAEGADIYPERLEIEALGIYAAPGAADAGKIWHSGDWAVEGEVLRIQAAHDAMLPYRVSRLTEAALELLDGDGARIVYERR